MIEFIDPNSNKTVARWYGISRKAYYVHGILSNRERWDMYPSTVRQINRIAFGMGMKKDDMEAIDYVGSEEFKKVYCDFSFQWGNNGYLSDGNNWLLNSVEDRRMASEKLIEHIKGNIGQCDEVVLIGHSHGGNVSIQAADKLFTEVPAIKRVFVLTIGTPAYNKLFIVSAVNNKRLTTIQEGICENVLYLGKEYIVPAMKFGRKMRGALGTVYLYVNCENPITWKHKDKISHVALWNKRDWADNAAWALDKLSLYQAMTLDNSGCFTNPATNNVEFDFKPKENRSNYERKIKPFAEWLGRLDYLRSCLIELRFKQYAMPDMPELLTYQGYISRREKMYLAGRMEQISVNEPDALWLNVTRPEASVKWKYPSARLKEKTDKLEELFKSVNAFYQFMAGIDCAKKRMESPDIQDVLDIYQQKYPEIEAIEKIKQEIYATTEFLEIARAIYLLDNASFGEHGFDLANPKLIEEAINDGRIKPFPRATTKSDI